MIVSLNLHSPLPHKRTYSAVQESQTTKVSLNTPVNNDVISFGGLTKKLSKCTYIDGQKDIEPFADKRIKEGKSLVSGQIPEFIQAKFPKDKREECIKEFYEVFDKITEELRNFDETKVGSIEEITKRRNNSTQKLLKDLLVKYKLAYQWDDVDLEYLGKGGKGAGYKIVGLRNPDESEDEYVIKVYHLIKGPDWQPYKSHGCYAETNSAVYWMKQAGFETQRGKYLFGNMSTGYMVIKYVDDDVRLPAKFVDPYFLGLKCTDEDLKKKHNTCKGYSYDWGGVRVVNRLKNGSKTARYVADKIKNTPEKYREQEWWRLFYDTKLDKSQKNAGLAMSIKHMPNKNQYIEECMSLNDPIVDRGLAYVLKYLPYNDAILYFNDLVRTKDVVTQIILFNEIPLLAMKHRDENVKDDLQTMRSEILPARIKRYYDISARFALPESIEHLASFVHLLPKDKFCEYYLNLAKTNNTALHDRMIYKLSNVENENKEFAYRTLYNNIKDKQLKRKIAKSINSYTNK